MAQITIVEPNGVERTRPLTAEGLTIGRGADNSLMLGYDKISRHHAQITVEAGAVYVTDLDSANGTYLGSVQLTPNLPTEWGTNQPLEVGDVTIYLTHSRPGGAAAGANLDVQETISGWVPDEEAEDIGGSRVWLYLLIAAAVVVCAAGYFYLS